MFKLITQNCKLQEKGFKRLFHASQSQHARKTPSRIFGSFFSHFSGGERRNGFASIRRISFRRSTFGRQTFLPKNGLLIRPTVVWSISFFFTLSTKMTVGQIVFGQKTRNHKKLHIQRERFFHHFSKNLTQIPSRGSSY